MCRRMLEGCGWCTKFLEFTRDGGNLDFELVLGRDGRVVGGFNDSTVSVLQWRYFCSGFTAQPDGPEKKLDSTIGGFDAYRTTCLIRRLSYFKRGNPISSRSGKSRSGGRRSRTGREGRVGSGKQGGDSK